MKKPSLVNLIKSARGEKRIDLLLKNAKMVNVLTGEIYLSSVAIADGYIVGFGDYKAEREIDLRGLYLAPGFIEGHIHIESSFLTPEEFGKVVLPHGTTTVICDPHEIANVLGLKGISYFLSSCSPLSIYVMLPSCVPATSLETSGATLSVKMLMRLASHPYVLGLAEMMNYPGVIYTDKEVISKIKAFSTRGRIDGHAPSLSGKPLYAYITAGIRSDHETITLQEAREKLRSGMYLFIREGSAAKNLETLLPVVTPENSRRCLLVSDDRHPDDLIESGHLDYTLRKAVRLGLDPIRAIQMVTLNPAEYFGLNKLGAIAPGRVADMVVLDNLSDFNVRMVFKRGQPMTNLKIPACRSCLSKDTQTGRRRRRIITNTVNLPHLKESDLEVKVLGARGRPAEGLRQRRIRLRRKTRLRRAGSDSNNIKVIGVIPHQIITQKIILPALIKDNKVIADTKRDILKIAVINRHRGSIPTFVGITRCNPALAGLTASKKSIGLGFVKGFGLKEGAIASTVAHDSHNLIVIGTNDKDMLFACEVIRKMQGGQVVVCDGKVLAKLPLPIAGIMSLASAEEVSRDIKRLNSAARKLGYRHPSPPLGTMSFLALPVIPELKLTDKGLVDVSKQTIVGLSGEE
ncbi:MAG: adenine deaminase [Planctomycetota bacterium]|nr:adenine deaminase [Planctomycetota bacterium]MDI6788467.1 adenine deaminase [Planctomycetota bacterium]